MPRMPQGPPPTTTYPVLPPASSRLPAAVAVRPSCRVVTNLLLMVQGRLMKAIGPRSLARPTRLMRGRNSEAGGHCFQSSVESGRRDLNPGPSGPKPDALPDCATPRGGCGEAARATHDRQDTQRVDPLVAEGPLGGALRANPPTDAPTTPAQAPPRDSRTGRGARRRGPR